MVRLEKIQLIVCSATPRAKKTLQVVSDVLSYSEKILMDNALCSERKVDTVQAYIDALIDKCSLKSVLVLIRQPLIGNILECITDETWLAWSMNASSLAAIEAISFSRGCSELKLMTHP